MVHYGNSAFNSIGRDLEGGSYLLNSIMKIQILKDVPPIGFGTSLLLHGHIPFEDDQVSDEHSSNVAARFHKQ